VKCLQKSRQFTRVVVDLANSPAFDDATAMNFFERAGRNLLGAEERASVRHHVALSVVGTQKLAASGDFRAKIRQEELIRESGIPYTIIHSTQFFRVPARDNQVVRRWRRHPTADRADPADRVGRSR
jgi:uncharacterized protein YbjT (DUF2867 family)